MRKWFVLSAMVSVLGTSPAWAGDVSVVMADGRVSVVAQNATLRQILTEWARVGQTKVVGAERLTGGPLTLHIENVPEKQALETLLRSASGYMAAPRSVVAANTSTYDRIFILPTSTAPAAGPVSAGGRSAPTLSPQPARQPPPELDPTNDLPADFLEEQARQAAEGDIGGNDQPAEAGFDYANPQLMMRQRLQQQQEQQQQQPATSAVPGAIVQPAGQAPNVFPGTLNPQVQPVNPNSVRPGQMVQPPTPQLNPYGLPPGVQPGSVEGGAAQPDRSKYINPYQPVPQDQP